MTTLRLYILRHAQSQWQIQPNDDFDTSLSSVGCRQALATADWLARTDELGGLGRSLDVICTSPLRRARETAECLGLALGVPLKVLDGLREADFHVASQLARAAGPHHLPVGTPSERYLTYRDQVRMTLAELVEIAEANGGRGLAVTHGGFVKTLLRVIAGSDQFCATLYNSCLNAVEWRRGRWHVLAVNMWGHLPLDLRTT